MAKDFLANGRDLYDINNTNIVLILMVDAPEFVSQFRPIGLCNFVYKIVALLLIK